MRSQESLRIFIFTTRRKSRINVLQLYIFLNELRKEQADTEIMHRQLQLGQRIRKGIERKRRETEEQITNVVNAYHTYVQGNDVYSYLKTIGYHVKF